MADKSKIEWTDATWNPIRGCTRVSEGCTNCYAETVAARFSGPGQPYDELAKMVTRPDGRHEARWTGEVRLIETHLDDPLRWRKPRMVFVNSMSDLFHEKVPDEWIDRIFAVMALAPQHTFQILTKRPERMRAYMAPNDPRRADSLGENVLALGFAGALESLRWPLPNVWLGVSVEDQATADERIPLLLDTPAAIRWISAEPLLGPVDLTVFRRAPSEVDLTLDGRERVKDYWFNALTSTRGVLMKDGRVLEAPEATDRHASLDWVVAGGESGPGARPTHPDWHRLFRDQCAAAGVPFFFKQWGAWKVVYDRDHDDPDWRRCGGVKRQTPNGRWLNLAGGHGFHGERVVRVNHVGKKAAGRTLDGRTHDELPHIGDVSV